MAGAPPPAMPASRARATAGNAFSSSGSNVHWWVAVQSTGAAAWGTRCGQPMARAMGMRMSGGLAWAIVDPSVNSTMGWVTDWRWTTTSMRWEGTANRRWASVSSSPLVTGVAGVSVMSGPMLRVGWAGAWAGVA